MEFTDLKPDKGIQSYVWNHQAHIATGPHFKLFKGSNTIDHAEVAIKQVDRCNISDPEAFSGLLVDLQAIKAKKLQGCVGYVDLLKSNDSFFFIQVWANEGDLRKQMISKGKFEESQAVSIISSLIRDFEDLVSKGMAHGNLRPENIQIHNKNFLLNDYGLNKLYQYFIIDKSKDFNEDFLYFSPQQMANTAKSIEKNDIFALGLIFYELIYGTLPWAGKSKVEYHQSMKKIPIRFPFNTPLSEKSKDFLKGCLQIEENARFSWDQIFKHPIYCSDSPLKKENNSCDSKAANLNSRNVKLIKEMQGIITKQSLDLEKLFGGFDKSGNKQLDIHEFTKLVAVIQPKVEMADIQEIFQRFDENHDGSMSFSEFKRLVVETDYRDGSENEQLAEFRGQKILDHIVNIILENHLDLPKMISQFDVTGDGTLKFGEFLPIIRVFDSGISDQDGKFVFKKFDKNYDGELSYEEFQIILELEIAKRAKIVTPPKKIEGKTAKMLEDLKKVIVFNKLDTKMVFKSFDKTSDAFLDFEEFRALVAIINARFTDKDIRDLFDLFDINKDQKVSFEEFQKALLN